MPLICRTLAIAGGGEAEELFKRSFKSPKYELSLVRNSEEAVLMTSARPIDLLVIDSDVGADENIKNLVRSLPTLIVDTGLTGYPEEMTREITRIRGAADELLRKSYITWIVDALNYSN